MMSANLHHFWEHFWPSGDFIAPTILRSRTWLGELEDDCRKDVGLMRKVSPASTKPNPFSFKFLLGKICTCDNPTVVRPDQEKTGNGGHSVCVRTIHQNAKLMIAQCNIPELTTGEFPIQTVSIVQEVTMEARFQEAFQLNSIENVSFKQWMQIGNKWHRNTKKKNQNFLNLCHKEDFGVNAEWNFFASSYGKNACGGVGGTVKRLAALGKTYEVEAKILKGMFEAAKTINGTQQFDSYSPVNETKVLLKSHSFSEESTSLAVARPLISIYNDKNEATGNTVALPAVFKAPIRPDVVNFVHDQMAKNHRQPYCVNKDAGHQTSAESWGTGRAVARIPRVRGGGTHRSGQGAFGNMCRGGRMFAPTKQWRRWHRKINVNQKRYAMVSAIAATGVPALVMSKGLLVVGSHALHLLSLAHLPGLAGGVVFILNFHLSSVLRGARGSVAFHHRDVFIGAAGALHISYGPACRRRLIKTPVSESLMRFNGRKWMSHAGLCDRLTRDSDRCNVLLLVKRHTLQYYLTAAQIAKNRHENLGKAWFGRHLVPVKRKWIYQFDLSNESCKVADGTLKYNKLGRVMILTISHSNAACESVFSQITIEHTEFSLLQTAHGSVQVDYLINCHPLCRDEGRPALLIPVCGPEMLVVRRLLELHTPCNSLHHFVLTCSDCSTSSRQFRSTGTLTPSSFIPSRGTPPADLEVVNTFPLTPGNSNLHNPSGSGHPKSFQDMAQSLAAFGPSPTVVGRLGENTPSKYRVVCVTGWDKYMVRLRLWPNTPS
ncbi:hypothetical protein PR048_025471 [Dryococelus australis]|uniref:60S ribosomal protein L4 n=1 Tax=Dryococelus australis TaxID=614101 RepID=A0ABQ9GRH0_9NEOP|nr:hypothetical protein PR048_025471 [Dryococelus australis]